MPKYYDYNFLVLIGILKRWLLLRQFRETPMYLQSKDSCGNYIKLQPADKEFLSKIPSDLFKKNNSKTLISKQEVLKLHQVLYE